jgi:hypothetical protein
MGSPRQMHRVSTMVLSAVMVVLGIALVIQAASGHGGILSARTLLGVLFIVGGTLRLWVERRRGPQP